MHTPMTETVTDLTKGVYRRLYSGFTKGQRINKLSLQAEAWFWRVLAAVDDFGNGDADPDLCRDATVGKRHCISATQVKKWLNEMRDVGLITYYTVNGEKFLHVVGFEETQPAGRNGKRIQRFRPPDGIQVNPGESKIIQNNPDLSSASDNDNDNDPEDDNDKRFAQDSPPYLGDQFLKTLAAFEEHRKEIRKPLKPTGRRALYKQLGGMGEECAVAAMEASIANGWQGIFPSKNGANNGANNDIRRTTAAERNGSQLARNLAVVEKLRRESGGDPSEVSSGNLTAVK